MPSSHHRSRGFFLCILIGAQLMCFALFLQPMNPEDFLSLAMTDPVQTFNSQSGLAMSIVFWLSLLLMIFGVIGWMDLPGRLANLRRSNKRSSFRSWHAR
jgi:hypothetical protein